jgi:hypothetical protein
MLKELLHGCDNSNKGCCNSNITDVATTRNQVYQSTQMNQNKKKHEESKVDDCNSTLVSQAR